MIERMIGSTPSGSNTPLLKMKMQEGAALKMPVNNAENGDGVFSMWIRGENGETGIVYVNFCGTVFSNEVNNQWTRVSFKGTINNSKPIYIYGRRSNGVITGYTIYIHKAQLESGNVLTGWTPNTYDDGSSLIMTEKKVYINTPEFDVDIKNSEYGLTINKDGASMEMLSVTNNFTAPNVRYIYNGNRSLSTSGTDLASILRQINNKHLMSDVKIYLDNDVFGDVVIEGVSGAELTIIGKRDSDSEQHSISGGAVTIKNCQSAIILKDLNVDTAYSTSYTSVVRIYNCSYVLIHGGRYRGSYSDQTNSSAIERCFSIEGKSSAYIYQSSIYDAANLIYCTNSNVSCYGLKGGCTKSTQQTGDIRGSLTAFYGQLSSVQWIGSRPFGTVTIRSNSCICAPSNLSSLTEAIDDDIPVFDPPIKLETKTFKTTTINNTGKYGATLYNNRGFSYSDQVYQGFCGWKTQRQLIGCVWFDFQNVHVDTIKSASIKVLRLSGSGNVHNVKVCLRPVQMTTSFDQTTKRSHIYNGSSSVPADIIDSTVGMSYTEEKEYTINSSHFNALKNIINNNYGLAFDPNDPDKQDYSNNYGKFDAKSIELTVVYETSNT